MIKAIILILVTLLVGCAGPSTDIISEQNIPKDSNQGNNMPSPSEGAAPQTITENNIVVPGSDDPNIVAPVSDITEKELRQHDSDSDCWVAYDANVYDITEYAPKNPRLLKYCGLSDLADALEDNEVFAIQDEGIYLGELK